MKKVTLVNSTHKNAMRLQSIGWVLGTPASEIKPGDSLMWNFGSVYVVNSIIKATPTKIVISTSPEKSSVVYEQRLKKTRLVCILHS